MIDISLINNPVGWIALAWTITQEVRFWKLCKSCPYREAYQKQKAQDIKDALG